MSEKRAITMEAVSFAYQSGQEMLFDVRFEPGRLTAIMGASGSGKSTLLALLAGYEVPIAGRIRFDDDDLTNAAPAARPISFVFQENNLFAHLTVFANVALGIAPPLKLDNGMRERVHAAIAHTGLAGKDERLPSELSGGERQRVALARALVRHKPVLLLDEAFASLGPGLRHTMLSLVRQMHDANGLTTLMITHSPDDAHTVADDTVFIDKGMVVASGPTESVLGGGQTHPAVARYLDMTAHNSVT